MTKPITYYISDLAVDIAEAIDALDPDQTIDLITDIMTHSSPNNQHDLGVDHLEYILQLPTPQIFALIRGMVDRDDVPDNYPSPWMRFIHGGDDE